MNCNMNTSVSKISLLKIDSPLETMNMIKLLGSTEGTVSPAYAEGKESTVFVFLDLDFL